MLSDQEIAIDRLCENIKIMHDVVHGDIQVTRAALRFIDNPKFQRLRFLKQLSTCYIVYSNANHSRFEHSIGTYFIASRMLRIITMIDPNRLDDYLSTIPELQNYYNRTYNGTSHVLDNYVCELIKLAALLHDIGHGPFSHLFDEFLFEIGKHDHKYASHEARSGAIIESIIKNDPELSFVIQDDEIQFIKNLIDPDETIHKGFVYQIVSNTMNSLDVDKFDYITRDSKMLDIQKGFKYKRLVDLITIIDNNIVYPEQVSYDIIDLFRKRHTLHKLVYSHKGVISAQYIIIDMMLELDHILNIGDRIDNIDSFCELTDSYILESTKFLPFIKNTLSDDKQKHLEKAMHLSSLLNNHQLYAFVGSHTTEKKLDLSEFIKAEPDAENIIVFQNKIGFISGNKNNPLDHIYCYKTKNAIDGQLVAHKLQIEDVTKLLSKNYQEHITIIFYKDKYNYDRIKKLRDSFNLFCQI